MGSSHPPSRASASHHTIGRASDSGLPTSEPRAARHCSRERMSGNPARARCSANVGSASHTSSSASEPVASSQPSCSPSRRAVAASRSPTNSRAASPSSSHRSFGWLEVRNIVRLRFQWRTRKPNFRYSPTACGHAQCASCVTPRKPCACADSWIWSISLPVGARLPDPTSKIVLGGFAAFSAVPSLRRMTQAGQTAPLVQALIARVGEWTGVVVGASDTLTSRARQGALWLAVNVPEARPTLSAAGSG